MKCLINRINEGNQRNPEKLVFHTVEATGISIATGRKEGQERSLVIKERSKMRMKKEQLFLRLFGKGFGDRLINIIQRSCNSREVRLNKT